MLALFFFRIPSIYFIPFWHSSFLTTQSLARIIFVFLFFYIFLVEKISIRSKITLQISFLILLLFFLQSLSVIYTNNIFSFLTRYKDIFVGYTSFFLFFFYRRQIRKILAILIIASICSIFYQVIMIFFQPLYNIFAYVFIYEKQVELSLINLNRGRIFLDSYDESIIPLLFYIYLSQNNSSGKKIFFLLFISISFLSFLSNWRIRILMLFAAWIGSCIYLFNKSKKFILTSSIGILGIGLFVYFIHQSILGFTFFDRLTLQDKNRDVETLLFRGVQFVRGIDEGISTSLGVGLGNYYDNLQFGEKLLPVSYNIASKEGKYAQEYIHNIFFLYLAESGLYSLVVFMIMCILFVRNDLEILKGKSLLNKSLVISFWTLFSYSLFNPPIPASYQILFWGLRGLLVETNTT